MVYPRLLNATNACGGKPAFLTAGSRGRVVQEKTMSIATINPATGETLQTFDALTTQEIEKKLQLAADTFRTYRHTDFS